MPGLHMIDIAGEFLRRSDAAAAGEGLLERGLQTSSDQLSALAWRASPTHEHQCWAVGPDLIGHICFLYLIFSIGTPTFPITTQNW